MTKEYAIGYIHNGTVHTTFMQSLLNVTHYDVSKPKLLKQTIGSVGPYIYQNRNQIVEGFLDQTKADWLLFVDVDITFHHEQPYYLLDFADDDHQILAGLYFSWLPTAANNGQHGLAPLWFVGIDPMMSAADLTNVPMPLVACGMGFTMLGRKMLEEMRKAYRHDPCPWFSHDICDCQDHAKPSRMGEDVTFCVRAKKIGYQTWGINTVVNHTKSHTENLDTFKQWNGEDSVRNG